MRPLPAIVGAAFMPPVPADWLQGRHLCRPYRNITTSSSFGLAPLNASSK